MKRFTAVLLVLLLCVSLASCSITIGETGKADPTTAPVTEPPTPTSAPDDLDLDADSDTDSDFGEKRFSSVEEFVQYEKIQEAINELKTSLEKETYSDVNVYANGNKLVYDYSFNKTYTSEEMAKMKEAFDNKEDEEFGCESILEEMITYVDIENPQVEVIFRDADGTVICNRVLG